MNSDNIIPLVLSLARVEPSGETMQKAGRIMEEGIDWQELYKFSFVHGVAPLLYKNLSSFSGVPPEVLHNFRKVYLFNIKDTVTAANELREIISSLADGGVESVPIKGVTVAEEVFGDASLYASSDIDILIRLKDIYLAADIMRKNGYSPADAEIEPPYPDYYEDLHFFKEGRKTVEVHFRLGQKRYFTIPESFWWEDVREKTFTGPCTYKVLSIERNLLYQSLHLFSHGYSPLKFIVVISESLRVFRDDIRWEKLTEDARRCRAERPLLLSVYLATRLLDAPVPPFVSDLLENLSQKERWIFQRVETKVFSSGARYSYIMFLLTVLQYDLFEVMGRMMKWIFPPLAEIRYRYDLPKTSRTVYLYYMLNPVLLLLKKRNH
jgi:Uncharacterised nucleotidyltransferase